MTKFKEFIVLMAAFLICLSLLGGNVSAAPKEDIPVKAIMVGLPGPVAYTGIIPNSKLPEVISSRDKKATVLNWISWGLTFFYAPGGVQSFVNSGASLIAGSPTARLQEAYYKGESVYYGGYYPTSKPGLTTIPFIYYSKTMLKFY